MNRNLTLLLVLLMIAPVLVASANNPKPSIVHLTSDLEFKPKVITVKAGTEVQWLADDGAHTILADDKTFKSGTVTPGHNFRHTFARPGSYPYYCSIHGDKGGVGMAGVVRVVP